MMRYSFRRSHTSQLKIVASGGLGDCLLLSPFIRHFRRSGLYDWIICATSVQAVELFDRNPHIDQVIPCRGNELFLWGAPEKDCAVFSPYMKITGPTELGAHMHVTAEPLHSPNQHRKTIVQQVAEYHGIRLENEALEIYTSEADERWADEVVSRLGGRPLLLISTGSSDRQKEYPVPYWQEVVDGLHAHATIIELSAGPSALKGTEVIRPMPNLRGTAALYKRMSCIITVDSFPNHLACAVGVPAVVLFGPSNQEVFGHSANTNIRVSACPPCSDTPRRIECKRSRCLEEISPSCIVQAVLSRCRSGSAL